MSGACGDCTACCRVFSIGELKKPAGKWCEHCDIGVGCKIYEARPKTCVDFKCLWLLSTETKESQLPLELRPDKCKVVFGPTTKPTIMSATTMTGSPLAWQRKDVQALIARMVRGGCKVVIGAPGSLTKIMVSESGMREVHMSEPDENGIQWNIKEE